MPKQTDSANLLKIEKASPRDLDSIIRIERKVTSRPMRKAQYAGEFLNPFSQFYVGRFTHTKVIAGYFIFWIIEGILEIHQITVDPRYQRRGIGQSFMEFLLDQARTKKVSEIFLEVRKSNSGALRFYRRFGLIQKSIRKNYYQNPPEDALILRKKTEASGKGPQAK